MEEWAFSRYCQLPIRRLSGLISDVFAPVAGASFNDDDLKEAHSSTRENMVRAQDTVCRHCTTLPKRQSTRPVTRERGLRDKTSAHNTYSLML